MKTYFAITKFDFGGMGIERHMAPYIGVDDNCDISKNRKAKAAEAKTLILEVKPVKSKMVVMPNGRKAKLFHVGDKIWARYSDGSACIDYKI